MNNQILIALVGNANARFLTLEPDEMPSHGFTLTEHASLSLPEGQTSGSELWTNTHTGRNRSSEGKSHSYDDHRQEHMIDFERHFAHAIAERMNQMLPERNLQEVLLVAGPQILGVMRPVLESALPPTVKLTDLAKDIGNLTPHEIQEYLSEQELIPAPQRLEIYPT